MGGAFAGNQIDEPFSFSEITVCLHRLWRLGIGWTYTGQLRLPTFFESMQALFTMTMDGSIFVAYAETLKPLTLGVAISAVSGIGLGYGLV